MRRVLPWCLLLAGCGGSSTSSPSADIPAAAEVAVDVAPAIDVPEVAEDTAPPDNRPPRVCRDGSVWAPGLAAFTDVTAQSGLVGVNGVRLSAADLDGDGRPELSVRNHVQGVRDDFGPKGARYTWVLHNDGGLKFSAVTEASGFTTTRDGGSGRTAHIVVFGDIDNDGDLDAFSGVNVPTDAAKDNGDRTELLLNDGAGHFTLAEGGDVRHEKQRLSTGGASFTDADLDGKLDLWVAYGTDAQYSPLPDRLYAGDGAGSFADVSKAMGLTLLPLAKISEANLALTNRNSWGATVCDVNGDGWPDLITSTYGRDHNGLWLSDGQGGYLNRALESGVGADDRLDWTTNMNAQCYCKLMPAAADCKGVPAPPNYFACTDVSKLRWDHAHDREPYRLGGNNFSTVCGDIDNDGDLDLMHDTIVHWDVGSSSDPSELLVNDGSGTFDRPGNDVTGLTREHDGLDWNDGDMTGAFFDFDGDGRQDVYIGSSDYPGTRGHLYHQKQDGTFEEVSPEDGIDHPRSHGVAVADFDGDGDLDLAAGHGISRCGGPPPDPTCYPTAEVHLFRNELGASGNWLQVRLRGGPGTNRAAIGARVRVVAGGVTQTREVGGGYGHYGIQSDVVQSFGLGEACDVDVIEVRWPDAKGTIETWKDVRANYRVTLERGGAATYDTDTEKTE